MKKYLIAILLIVAAIGAFLYYSSRRSAPPIVPAVADQQVKEETEAYVIDIGYPQFTGVNWQPDVNGAVKGVIETEISEFKANLSELSLEPLPEGMKSGLYGDYEISLFSETVASVEFKMSAYSAGAAHPNNYTIGFNYDLRNGRSLELSNLFNSGSAYLTSISEVAQADLKGQLAQREAPEEGVEGGAAPTAENYRTFVLTKDGIVFFFDPYQIAAYAAGGFEVEIPYEQVADILDPNFAVLVIPESI